MDVEMVLNLLIFHVVYKFIKLIAVYLICILETVLIIFCLYEDNEEVYEITTLCVLPTKF
jgi:hypothetical protein